ncbi:MAG TPA: hypothetical protein VIC04_08535 [Terriglobia bacterium]|jgi:hypothetical protein
MRRTGLAFLVLGAILIAPGAGAQHEEHANQTKPEAGSPAPPMMPGGMMSGGMMSGGMMSGMAMCQQTATGEAMCPHQEMKGLVQQVVTSFEAIQKEQNPATLKSKLAEHGTLLNKLLAASQKTCPMMGMMEQMQNHTTSPETGGGGHE